MWCTHNWHICCQRFLLNIQSLIFFFHNKTETYATNWTAIKQKMKLHKIPPSKRYTHIFIPYKKKKVIQIWKQIKKHPFSRYYTFYEQSHLIKSCITLQQQNPKKKRVGTITICLLPHVYWFLYIIFNKLNYILLRVKKKKICRPAILKYSMNIYFCIYKQTHIKYT